MTITIPTEQLSPAVIHVAMIHEWAILQVLGRPSPVEALKELKPEDPCIAQTESLVALYTLYKDGLDMLQEYGLSLGHNGEEVAFLDVAKSHFEWEFHCSQESGFVSNKTAARNYGLKLKKQLRTLFNVEAPEHLPLDDPEYLPLFAEGQLNNSAHFLQFLITNIAAGRMKKTVEEVEESSLQPQCIDWVKLQRQCDSWVDRLCGWQGKNNEFCHRKTTPNTRPGSPIGQKKPRKKQQKRKARGTP